MKRGHDGLESGDFRLRVDADGNAVAIVGDAHIVVGEECDLDIVTAVHHRLVARVVEDLPNEVMEAFGTRRPDVHAGALPDRLEPFEDGY